MWNVNGNCMLMLYKRIMMGAIMVNCIKIPPPLYFNSDQKGEKELKLIINVHIYKFIMFSTSNPYHLLPSFDLFFFFDFSFKLLIFRFIEKLPVQIFFPLILILQHFIRPLSLSHRCMME